MRYSVTVLQTMNDISIYFTYFSFSCANQEVNFDSDRGGVTVITEKGDITTSYLYIQQARKSDEGIYRCSPSNANNATVRVHILLGEFS